MRNGAGTDYCLDAWPVLEYLKDAQPVSDRVEMILAGRPLMSWVNFGEVFYITHREHGADRADEIVAQLQPQLRLDLPSAVRVMAAARIKATHRVSYADAFGLATAIARGAVLLTGDPEILHANAGWPVEDVRAVTAQE